MEPALLARIQDELGLGEALLAEPAALLAAARRSLRLEPAEASDASVREVCEELGLDPAQPSPSPAAAAPAAPPPDAPPADVVAAPAADSAAAEEGVPPPGRGRPAPSLLAPPPAIAGPPAGAGGVPPAYAEALDLLEDPRRVYAVARATPGPKPPPEWRDQLLAQLALRNEFQGGTLRGLIELFNAVVVDEQAVRDRSARSTEENKSLQLERTKLVAQLRDLSTHGASSAERDELQQKVSELQAKLISNYEERERAAEQRQQLEEAEKQLALTKGEVQRLGLACHEEQRKGSETAARLAASEQLREDLETQLRQHQESVERAAREQEQRAAAWDAAA